MIETSHTSDLENQLDDLRHGAFRFVLLFLGFISYLWLALTVWPTWGQPTPPQQWVGSIQFMCGVFLSYALHKAGSRFASSILIGSFIIAIVLFDLTSNINGTVYTLSLPVIFASVLLSRKAVLLVGIIASGFALWLSSSEGISNPVSFIETITPMCVIALIAAMSLLSVRNLYTALTWAMINYKRANHHKFIAQERHAELQKVLKSLDTATYNLKRANYMLTLARNRAEEAQRLKQQFAQNISHELRTPLNLIIGFTETMMQSPEYYGGHLSAAHLRDLGIVYRNAMHLQNMVNDVLDLARIEAAQLTITTEITDTAQLVQDTVDTARTLIESRGLYLRTEIEPDLPPIRVDPTRIRQVIFNLLNNAARFTDTGGITVRACRREDAVVFAVVDTGIGISPAELSRVFDAFHQVEGSTQRRQGGAGLGLAISHQFVTLHGGKIWVESEVGQGSTFYFSIPVEQALEYEISNVRDQVIEITNGDTLHDRILLTITRSPSAAAMLARYINNCRHIFVKDLQQAHEFIQRTTPQSIVIDTTTYPQDEGSLRQLAESWNLPHAPLIACPMPGEETLRKKHDTRGFLIKPVTRDNLWDMIRQVDENIDRVLIVDDDQDFVRLMNRMLDNPVRHYQVYNAYSGQEGLAMMQFYQPDLVLLDLGLPDIDGLRVLKIIQDTPEIRHIPVIIVTARDEIDMTESLSGTMLVTKLDGLMRGEIVQWIQELLDTTTRIQHVKRL